MRIVILGPSPYSESSIAVAVRLAKLGYTPAGALTLSSFNLPTLARKFGQWGSREVVGYVQRKMFSHGQAKLRNPYLQPLLQNGGERFRSIRQLAKRYGFPVAVCKNQNTAKAVAQLREWSPDLAVFTGGNILRQPLLNVPRLGIINLHLAMLPHVRGMSTPEWSLLKSIPVGVTIHYIDAGVDTGPILARFELPDLADCSSLDDLRNRLIAFGVEKVGEVVAGLDRGTISAQPQSELNLDHQYFVIHERLKNLAARRLQQTGRPLAEVELHE